MTFIIFPDVVNIALETLVNRMITEINLPSVLARYLSYVVMISFTHSDGNLVNCIDSIIPS